MTPRPSSWHALPARAWGNEALHLQACGHMIHTAAWHHTQGTSNQWWRGSIVSVQPTNNVLGYGGMDHPDNQNLSSYSQATLVGQQLASWPPSWLPPPMSSVQFAVGLVAQWRLQVCRFLSKMWVFVASKIFQWHSMKAYLVQNMIRILCLKTILKNYPGKRPQTV